MRATWKTFTVAAVCAASWHVSLAQVALVRQINLRTVPNAGEAIVDCGKGGSLQRAINVSRLGETILVSGTCDENVTIPAGKDLLTLNGGGAATINGLNNNLATVSITGRDITIRGFTVMGGNDGIEVARGGGATIDSNVIRNNGNFGINLVNGAFATIVNNMVYNNRNAGIAVNSNSSAWIGFLSLSDTIGSPNVITANAQQGIVTRRGASAVIVGNDISDNMANGLRITESSYARLSGNTINHNGQNGIFVEQGSGALLAPPPPPTVTETIFTRPNSTTINNGGFGVWCQVGGYTDGRLGTIAGANGAKNYSEGCIDSLIP